MDDIFVVAAWLLALGVIAAVIWGCLIALHIMPSPRVWRARHGDHNDDA